MNTRPATLGEAIIYLRLSDFRDEDPGTFEAREAELRELAADLGLTVARVAIENDLNGNGRTRGASAYKTPKRVTVAGGLVTFRTNRPIFEGVVRDLQNGVAKVLIVADDSRIARNHRDGLDLLDAARVARASVVAPDDEGDPRWLLTEGGTRSEVAAFQGRIEDARKYSEQVAAKVAKGRVRWAGKSYQGGRRPFGYQVDTTTDQHARNLIVDQAEAELLRGAATRLLGRKSSLAAEVRKLRADGVPTVTGAEWQTRTLKDALIKPTVAGLAVRKGQLVPAVWEAILDRPVWDGLREMFADPGRRTNGRGTEPRWLVSLFAKCGVCGLPMTVGGAGGKGARRSPQYRTPECGHVSRNAPAVDAWITELVVARLEQPDAADLLKPLPRPEVDGAKLAAELAKVRDRRKMFVRQAAAGLLDEADLEAAAEVLNGQEAAIMAQLASTDETDPLDDFRGQPARVVWDALPVVRKRAVVQTLFESIRINRAEHRTGRVFDPSLIEVRWAA